MIGCEISLLTLLRKEDEAVCNVNYLENVTKADLDANLLDLYAVDKANLVKAQKQLVNVRTKICSYFQGGNTT